MYVIQTTARRKNLLPSVTASQCNVILKGFALKNLPATACHAERSKASPPKRFCMRSLTFVRDDVEIPRRPIGLARNDIIVILNGTAWSEESLVKTYVFLKGFASKNLFLSEPYCMRSLTCVRDDIACHLERREEESLPCDSNMKFLVGLSLSLGMIPSLNGICHKSATKEKTDFFSWVRIIRYFCTATNKRTYYHEETDIRRSVCGALLGCRPCARFTALSKSIFIALRTGRRPAAPPYAQRKSLSHEKRLGCRGATGNTSL